MIGPLGRVGVRVEWQIVDRLGFRELRLGMERQQVRDVLGDVRSFSRVPGTPPLDDFPSDGVQVTYDDDAVVFLEVVAPADPSVSGIPLLAAEFSQVASALSRMGFHVTPDDVGGVIEELGVGLYAPAAVVEAVSIGEPVAGAR